MVFVLRFNGLGCCRVCCSTVMPDKPDCSERKTRFTFTIQKSSWIKLIPGKVGCNPKFVYGLSSKYYIYHLSLLEGSSKYPNTSPLTPVGLPPLMHNAAGRTTILDKLMLRKKGQPSLGSVGSTNSKPIMGSIIHAERIPVPRMVRY